MHGRVPSIILMSCALVMLFAGAAHATFSQNDIGCKGSAVIRGPSGRVTVNATDATATIPRQGIVRWQGSTSAVSKNHSGHVTVAVGPFGITLGEWGDPNQEEKKSKKGTRRLPDALVDVPPGVYLVTGSHSGDSGTCAGEMRVRLAEEGGATAPWKPIALGGTGLFALATLAAGIGRTP